MPRRRLLLITYYWPPCGGVSVQRWLQHVRYLRENGWEPVVATAAGADYPSEDPALVAAVPAGIEILRIPIWEPYGIYRKLTGRKEGEQMQSAFNAADTTPSLAQRISVFIRSNFFIPDARMFWRRPAARFLRRWLRDNPVDAIVSNGTPHTDHLIALDLHRTFPGIPWLADFRDPWTGIDYFAELQLTPRALAKHRRLERTVLETADLVTTVSWAWREDFRRISGKDNVAVVTNGYDPRQFTGEVAMDRDFSIYHTGVLGKDRNVPALWRALRRLTATEPGFAEDLRLVLIGETDGTVRQALEEHQLVAYLERHPFLPHAEVIRRIRGGQLLLLIVNQAHDAPGRLPGKLYEYLGAERPILAISPLRGDAAKILAETGAGTLLLTGEEDRLHDHLRDQYHAWKAGNLAVVSRGTEAYSRQATTRRLAGLLDRLVKKE